jgi:hypothetical protein
MLSLTKKGFRATPKKVLRSNKKCLLSVEKSSSFSSILKRKLQSSFYIIVHLLGRELTVWKKMLEISELYVTKIKGYSESLDLSILLTRVLNRFKYLFLYGWL